MPDYTFYKEQFAGEDIPESEFPRFLKRAEIELKRMRRIYPMTPAGAYTEESAAEMALCAIADAMYEFAQEDERRGLARVSIGSVSGPTPPRRSFAPARWTTAHGITGARPDTITA